MKQTKIANILSEAIKNKNWVAIEYKNQEDETTKFWIAIQDISIKEKKLKVDSFNIVKIQNLNHGNIKNAYIFFEQIKSACLIENTTYKQNPKLVEKITENIEELNWLNYEINSDNLINYIIESIKQEEPKFKEETTTLSGVDLDILKKEETVLLDNEQVIKLVNKLEKVAREEKKERKKVLKLALNLLSIKTKKGLFVVGYNELLYDPSDHSLTIADKPKVNFTFTENNNENSKYNLKNYLDYDSDDFDKLFKNNPREGIKKIAEVFKSRTEKLDTTPYIFELYEFSNNNLEMEFLNIKENRKLNNLEYPLKAFFGNMTKDFMKGKKREVNIKLIDNNINEYQIRVIYNSLTAPVTYVQGPPGTGKTHTIINVLISAFFNDDKVLVSSNNNKPINDIYEKITKFTLNNLPICLPFIRLGNFQETEKTLEFIKENIEKFSNIPVYDETLSVYKYKNKENSKEITEYFKKYEEKAELLEEINTLEGFKEKINDIENHKQLFGYDFSTIDKDIENKKNLANQINLDKYDKELAKVDETLLKWLNYTGIKHYQKLIKEPKYSELINILKIEDSETKVNEFNKYLLNHENFQNFLKIFPIILTTNQSAHRLGYQYPSFDLVIIDEAGQSSIGYSLLPISRGKRVLLVGDQNQLKPVIDIPNTVNNELKNKYMINENYDYLKNSILSTMQSVDTISKMILLEMHYRSKEKIINFSNKKYYENKLKIMNNKDDIDSLEFINIISSNLSSSKISNNISIEECNYIIDDIKNKKTEKVGIITPFRNQAQMIKNSLESEKLDHVDVGTIHTFQGDEKDVIYLSLAITKGTNKKAFDWIKDNKELINVAMTRAKNKFILVADEKEIKSRSEFTSDIQELINYVKNNGNSVVSKSSSYNYVNGNNYRSFDVESEKEFFETFKLAITNSVNNVDFKNKLKIGDIFSKEDIIKYNNIFKKDTFDLAIYDKIKQKYVMVVEYIGNNYIIKEDLELNKLKEKMTEKYKLKWISIDNSYSRRYFYIKDLIIKYIKQY